jgi:hypothetical protein
MPIFIVVSPRGNDAPSITEAIRRETLAHYELKDDA